MFAEVKRNLPISGDGYDGQIIDQINAAALDLTRTAEIILPGAIDVSMDPETGAVTDNSTVTDALIISTIALYCEMRIGNPPNYERLLAAYEMNKGNLRLSGDYTDYPADEDDAADDAGADPAEADPAAETPAEPTDGAEGSDNGN